MTSGVDECLCDFKRPRDAISEKRKKKKIHGWLVQGGVDPGRCSTPSQHQQLLHYTPHPHTNDNRLGSVVPNNKIARVAVK